MSEYDAWGLRRRQARTEPPDPAAAGMTAPVRCNFCQRVYDLGAVEVTARYADCSVWKTPCCRNTADDRGDTGWKTRKDYERIERSR